MKILITLDYEVFLGSKTGTVQNNLIIPMNKLTSVGNKFGIKFTIFVDASYLYVINKLGKQYPSLQKDFDEIYEHIIILNNDGHDIQLHIHPHWFFSSYNGSEWIIDTEHYKLSDLAVEEAKVIFKKSKEILESIINKKLVAFRAGGFSAQPTRLLTSLLKENDIKIDSSVYSGAYYNSSSQKYDYRNVPQKGSYLFNRDICVEDNLQGEFLEIPISTIKLNPLFYWKLVFTRLRKSAKHKTYGNGISLKATHDSIIKRLTQYSYASATIDGYKISYLQKVLEVRKKQESDLLTIIGHPKLVTPYSIQEFKKFCSRNVDSNNSITIKKIYENVTSY